MHKKNKQLIFSALVLVLLSLIYLITGKIEDKKTLNKTVATETEERAFVHFISFPTKEMIKIEIEDSAASTVFEKREGQWVLISPEVVTRQQMVDSTVASVTGAGSDKIVEESALDLTIYGISPTSSRTTITSASGEKVIILLGNKTPSGSGYYASLEGDPAVYLLPTYTAEKLSPHIDSLRDRNLPVINVKELSYIKAEGEKTIEIVPTVQDDNDGLISIFSSYTMIQPYEEPCGVNSDIIGRYLQAQSSDPLMKIEFIDDYSSLAEVGLDEVHSRSITYKDAEGNSFSLIIGKALNEKEYTSPAEQPGQYSTPFGARSEYYAMQPGGKEVFTISGAWAGLVEANPFTLRNGSVCLVPLDSIDSFTFTFKGESWNGSLKREKQDESSLTTYTFQGKDIPEDDFKDMYQDILYIIYEGEANPSYKLPKQSPEASVYFKGTPETNSETRADFYPYDSRYYIVKVDDKAPHFLVGRYQLEGIAQNLSPQKM
jgi:hypothetical protein